MKRLKKFLPVLLALIIPISTVGALAVGSEPTEKEEVIYINLNANGEVKDIYAVNIFGGGEITDYGDYSSVEMLNTTDKINTSGDKVTFSASADRVYYKGKLDNNEIPWNISIRFFLDGKEYPASEVAGKSGKLEIRFKITKNENCKGNFYDKYALQASFTLDTEKCRDIVAPDATVANVGAKKQLSYLVLPGKGIDTAITAEVEEFSMPAVSVNGVSLSMNIEIDDMGLLNQVNELVNAINTLDDGAGKLSDGTGALKDGANALNIGAGELSDGAGDLNVGAEALNNGVVLIGQGLDELNSKSSELTEGSAQVMSALLEIKSGLDEAQAFADKIKALVNGLGEIQNAMNTIAENIAKLKELINQNNPDLEGLKAENEQKIEELKAKISELKSLGANTAELEDILELIKSNCDAISGMEGCFDSVSDIIDEINAQKEALVQKYEALKNEINSLVSELKGIIINMSKLKGGIDTLVTEYQKLDGGINEYTAGVAKIVAGYNGVISGANDLMTGSKSLALGAEDLSEGTGSLVNGVSKLGGGTDELKSGTAEMREKTEGMDGKISEQIDRMLNSLTGAGEETVSFVSEKNTNIKSVQFVIKTEAVEIDDTPAAAPVKAEKLNFWQKLLRLFGLY
ncbi:MAG: hypothetical protein ACI4FN_04815 [Acutalibacteraceae bacterium]